MSNAVSFNLSVAIEPMMLRVRETVYAKQSDILVMLDEKIQAALTPENLEREIKRIADGCIQTVLNEEVSRYLKVGNGRSMLSKAIAIHLDEYAIAAGSSPRHRFLEEWSGD